MIKLGTAEVTEVKKNGAVKLTPLTNGRALNKEEEEAEEKAESLPRAKYKRILPLPGTLAYLFRDIEGGNYTIANSVLETTLADVNKRNPNTIVGKANKVILLWNNFDEFSKRRIDVFDWLCEEVNLRKKKFYAIVMEGLYDHFDAISQRLLMESKPELINNARQFAKEERNFRDRELLAKATGVTKDAPLIGSIDNSTKIQNNLNYQSGFSDVIKDTEKIIQGEDNVDFVDAEIVENERKSLKPASFENYIDANLFKEEKEEEFAERKVEIK